MTTQLVSAVSVALGLAVVSAGPARADDVADFYKGKTISIVNSFSAGGVYGLHGHLIAEYLPKHLPGRPTVIMQFMPGAGGLKSANYLYNAAPKDGSVLGELFKDVALNQRLTPRAVKYDASRFVYIGRVADFPTVTWVTDKAPARTMEDAKKAEVILGATGRASASFMEPTMLNALIGTRFKIVTGYKAAADLNQAAESGETYGWGGTAFSGFRIPGSRRDEWKAGKVFFLAQSGSRRQPELPDVPLLTELVSDDAGKQIMKVLGSGTDVGVHLEAPPGLPAARVATLRAGFDAMMRDPAYLAAAKKVSLDIVPMNGDELQAVVAQTLAVPEPVMERARKVLGL